jgi:hypothetical protein
MATKFKFQGGNMERIIEDVGTMMAVIDDPDGMYEYFMGVEKNELVCIAIEMYYDSLRLRRELDEATGVIR